MTPLCPTPTECGRDSKRGCYACGDGLAADLEDHAPTETYDDGDDE